MRFASVSRGWLLSAVVPVLSLLATGAAAGAEGVPAPGTLKWTPHRAAATPPDAAAPETSEPAPAGDAATEPPVAAPPARLAPPPDSRPTQEPPAPPASARREPRTLPPSAARAPAPWPSPNRVPGVSPGTVPPRDGAPSLFGMKLFRTPQGDADRPMFAGEPAPEREGVRPAAASGPEGLRFTPRQPGAGRDRVARGPDGSPSVAARLPGSSMSTASMPRARAAMRRVSDQPTPADLPPPASSRSSAGRPTPADDLPPGADPRGAAPRMDDGTPAYEGPLDFGDGVPGADGGFPMLEDGYGDDGLVFPDDGMGMEGMTMDGMPIDGMPMMDGVPMEDGPWYGGVTMHIPSFYDDPYACEDGEYCPGCHPWWDHDGRVLAFFRRLGRPYYGWRWYRDFTASVGVTSFQNTSDLGIHGNYGVNEYLNWSMPFWNAFGVGWQIGVRGVQADFQQTKVLQANGTPIYSTKSRNQVFLTTGFFTRAFEGRGLQGGAVWDYLQDDWFETAEASQVRGELSYVWGYNEFGFWGAFNTFNQNGIYAPGKRGNRAHYDTLDLYTGFYRLQFGDANELKIWGGGTGQGDGILGTLVRAPMSRSLALEGTFTYLIPRTANTVSLPTGEKINFSEQAWNISANIVWYPACRARRSLASPYRPLFEVADNGSMITAVTARP